MQAKRSARDSSSTTAFDYDRYVKVTTMKPSLTTKKNRKVRRLQERDPFVRIELFGRRDVPRLDARFGAEPPA